MNFTDRFLTLCQNAQDQGVTTLSHLRCLAILTRHADGLRMGELAEHAGLSSASLTSITDALVRLKLVQRDFRPTDRRSIWLRLTTEGETFMAKLFS